ncbi:hypothetical protein [Aquitalea sp. ASV15]|uniref:hypothetical protein n=1 Tax=Aquitalea sp. ASV15 TaxID=2795104 RepID=UPI0018ECBE73|nr:hypothetical protein [Aquitalea sp. ASV15]
MPSPAWPSCFAVADGWAVCNCKKWNAIQKNNFVLVLRWGVVSGGHYWQATGMRFCLSVSAGKCRPGLHLWRDRAQGFPALKQGGAADFCACFRLLYFFNVLI